MKKVALVILNYNGIDFLKKFLPIVIEHSVNDADIWVADNCSTDDSVKLLQQKFPNINIIENKKNGGYATGYNIALQQIIADYYILLNSDIEVTPNWITPIINLMNSDENIAACQPKIRSYYQKEKFEYAGASGGFIDSYGYPFCRGRLFQDIETDNNQYNDSTEVFWASGACLFVRADVFHQLGGFDDDFFAHMEEIDLCWRMKGIGKKIMVCPSSMVYHVGGGTLPVGSSRKTYLNFRNNFVLLYKNLPSNKLFIVLFLRLFLDGFAGIKFLLQGGFPDFIAVIKSHFYFYRNWAHIHKKRKSTIRNNTSNIYTGNIAIEYYLLKVKKFSNLKKVFTK